MKTEILEEGQGSRNQLSGSPGVWLESSTHFPRGTSCRRDPGCGLPSGCLTAAARWSEGAAGDSGLTPPKGLAVPAAQ